MWQKQRNLKKRNFFKILNTNANAKRNMELMKLNAPNETVYKGKNEKMIYRSIYYDRSDYPQNLENAIKIVDKLKIDVYIRPHIDLDKLKNPEYLINNVLADLKFDFKKNNYNSIKSAIDAAKNQNAKIVVFDFTKSFKTLDYKKVNRIMHGKITQTRGNSFTEFIFLYKENAVIVSRKEILEGKLENELKKLTAKPKI